MGKILCSSPIEKCERSNHSYLGTTKVLKCWVSMKKLLSLYVE